MRQRRRLERAGKATGLAGIVVFAAWVLAAAVLDRRSVVAFLVFQSLFVLTAILFGWAAAIQKASDRQDLPPALLSIPVRSGRSDATGFLPFADPPGPIAPYAVPAAMGAAFTVVMVLRLTTPRAADDWSGLTAVVAILLLAGVAAGSGVLLRQVQLVLRARRRHEAGITLAADHLAIHDDLSFRDTAYLTQDMVARVLRPSPGSRLAPRSTTLGPPHAAPNVCVELTGPIYFPAATGIPQFGTDLNAPPPSAHRAGRRLYFCLADDDDIGRLQEWLEG